MSPRIVISPELHDVLVDVREDRDLATLNQTIRSLLDRPVTRTRDVGQSEDTLPVQVSAETRELLSYYRDRDGYRNFEDVIRQRGGVEPPLPPRNPMADQLEAR